MKLKPGYFLGIFYAFLYCLVAALAQVYVGHIEQDINPFTVLFYSFLFTSIFFNIFSIKDWLHHKNCLKNNKKLFFNINLSSLAAWFCTIYSLKYIYPSVASALIMGTIPITTIMILANRHEKLKLNDWLFSAIVTSLIILISVYYLHRDGYAIYDIQTLLSLLLAVTAGIANAFTNIFAKNLFSREVSASQILAHRFYLTVIGSFVFLLAASPDNLFISHSLGLKIILSSFGLIIIPLYFLQLSIKHTDSMTVSYTMPLLPVAAFFLQLIDDRIKFSPTLLGLTVLLSMVTIISIFYRSRK